MIKKLRMKKNYTQEDMAEILNISIRHYVRIDNERTIPRADIFSKLIEVLEMNKSQIGEFVETVLKNKGLK